MGAASPCGLRSGERRQGDVRTDPAQKCGEQFNDLVDVPRAGDLNGGVHVTKGNGDQCHWNADTGK